MCRRTSCRGLFAQDPCAFGDGIIDQLHAYTAAHQAVQAILADSSLDPSSIDGATTTAITTGTAPEPLRTFVESLYEECTADGMRRARRFIMPARIV